MDNLIFSLNATMPVFLMMVVGYGLRRGGLVSDELASLSNSFVFRVALPALLFHDLATMDIGEVWDGGFVAFCALATLASIAISYVVALAFRGADWRGEAVQAQFRSATTFLGVAFVQNIYGNAGAAPLMIIGAAPIYNVVSVIILELMRPGQGRVTRELLRKSLRQIATNPLILAILAGAAWSALRLPLPGIVDTTIGQVGGLATPLGLIALGASFDARRALAMRVPTLVCTLMKLVGMAAVFVPCAVALGYTGQKLVAALMMLGLPTTVSAFVMARGMGHDGTLTSSVVMLSTLLSSVTLTAWLWLLRSLGLV